MARAAPEYRRPGRLALTGLSEAGAPSGPGKPRPQDDGARRLGLPSARACRPPAVTARPSRLDATPRQRTMSSPGGGSPNLAQARLPTTSFCGGPKANLGQRWSRRRRSGRMVTIRLRRSAPGRAGSHRCRAGTDGSPPVTNKLPMPVAVAITGQVEALQPPRSPSAPLPPQPRSRTRMSISSGIANQFVHRKKSTTVSFHGVKLLSAPHTAFLNEAVAPVLQLLRQPWHLVHGLRHLLLPSGECQSCRTLGMRQALTSIG